MDEIQECKWDNLKFRYKSHFGMTVSNEGNGGEKNWFWIMYLGYLNLQIHWKFVITVLDVSASQ